LFRAPRIAAAIALLLCATAPAAWAAPLDDCDAGRHQYTEIRRIAATAMTDGEVEFLCGVCGERFTETLFASNHLWGDWVTDKPPTCTQTGIRRRTCTRAKPHDEYATIPALGHDYNESIAKPDCEKEGVKTFKCVRCGHTYTEPIPSLKHSYEESVEKEPSCLEPGLKRFTCKNNPAHTYTQRIPAPGSHSYGEWQEKNPAGEGTEGLEVRICARCGYEDSRPIAALAIPTTQPATTPATEPATEPVAEPVTEPPKPLPVVDIVLVGANVVSLGFFAFLFIPFIPCLLYIKRRQDAIKRRDELRKEVEERCGFT